jgi:uncharacterized protein with FMN-binding domain
LVILVIAMITVPLVGCADKTTTEPENVASLKAGTYMGVGKGKNGDVKVEVTFDDSKITEMEFLVGGF